MASVSPLLISTFESSVRLSMIGLVTVAPPKVKVASPTLLLISGFTISEMKSSLLIDGVTVERVAEFLVLESAEHRLRGLLVEVQLRHRLAAGDLDLRLQVVRGDDARIREELRVGVFIQQAQGGGELRDAEDRELAGERTGGFEPSVAAGEEIEAGTGRW